MVRSCHQLPCAVVVLACLLGLSAVSAAWAPREAPAARLLLQARDGDAQSLPDTSEDNTAPAVAAPDTQLEAEAPTQAVAPNADDRHDEPTPAVPGPADRAAGQPALAKSLAADTDTVSQPLDPECNGLPSIYPANSLGWVTCHGLGLNGWLKICSADCIPGFKPHPDLGAPTTSCRLGTGWEKPTGACVPSDARDICDLGPSSEVPAHTAGGWQCGNSSGVNHQHYAVTCTARCAPGFEPEDVLVGEPSSTCIRQDQRWSKVTGRCIQSAGGMSAWGLCKPVSRAAPRNSRGWTQCFAKLERGMVFSICTADCLPNFYTSPPNAYSRPMITCNTNVGQWSRVSGACRRRS